jgi:hypothetical protein
MMRTPRLCEETPSEPKRSLDSDGAILCIIPCRRKGDSNVNAYPR